MKIKTSTIKREYNYFGLQHLHCVKVNINLVGGKIIKAHKRYKNITGTIARLVYYN